QPFDGGHHERDGDDADDDADRSENRAQFVGADGAPGNAQALLKFGEEVHGDGPCSVVRMVLVLDLLHEFSRTRTRTRRSEESAFIAQATVAAIRPSTAGAGASVRCSSLAIKPSRMRIMRWACLATSSSCVTTMMVWPFLES